MFKKILIANRGEIAVRVIRACRELGIKTVAVYSEVDRDSIHTKLADESVCIGPGPAVESYLSIPNLISAATITGADAIHPGYGFLAESTYFADVCESCNMKFIGPSKEAIQKMGDKIQARKIMEKAGVPPVPGITEKLNPEDPNLYKIVKKLGYPVMIKAAAGGGGKGIRIVPSEEVLKTAIATAQVEAKASFGSDDVYLEKFLESPRHIEFQIAADKKGNACYFPERDCSIQRRYQKLLEESPSPGIDKDLRKKMGRAALKAVRAAKYSTVGTVEFLLDKKEHFYFLEMNTRIQVEHTITEVITGIDLVKLQIKLAFGEELKLDSDDIKICGHAIECRINAEDINKDFMPSPGRITDLRLPGGPGVRLDTHIYDGYNIPTFYDSLIAKIVVSGDDRVEAIVRMSRALREFSIGGVQTTILLYEKILKNENFIEGEYYNDFIVKHL